MHCKIGKYDFVIYKNWDIVCYYPKDNSTHECWIFGKGRLSHGEEKEHYYIVTFNKYIKLWAFRSMLTAQKRGQQ